jgi:beta-glucosidase
LRERAVRCLAVSNSLPAEPNPSLPSDFVWGAATAAYQIEGAVNEDGRGPSIWDTFSHAPGRVVNGETGDVACDHYHRWPADLDLLTGAGLTGYRFSVAWPRIQPTGAGRVESRGLEFYRRLAGGLRERGIAPFVTLYHWDLPQALEDRGGWRSRDTALRFADYAEIVAGALSEFGPTWITLNEPYCSAITGYAEGRHAPGLREGHGALAAAHHLLLAHGLAVARLRHARTCDGGAGVGITLNLSPAVAASDAVEDLAAADRQDLLMNRLFTDPVLGGRYPVGAEALWGADTDFSFRRDGDLATIGEPLDFLGVNYYYRSHVRAAARPEPPRSAFDIGVSPVALSDVDMTGMGWPVEPAGLYATLTGLRERFPSLPPVYVTENGVAYPDEVGVPDDRRIAFVGSHLDALAQARADGVDVRGYFYWSLLDNFEWARGYAPRFGLVHVDYPTQTRTPKASYHWLRDLIAENRPDLGLGGGS